MCENTEGPDEAGDGGSRVSVCYPVLIPVDRVSEACAEYRRGTMVAHG